METLKTAPRPSGDVVFAILERMERAPRAAAAAATLAKETTQLCALVLTEEGAKETREECVMFHPKCIRPEVAKFMWQGGVTFFLLVTP